MHVKNSKLELQNFVESKLRKWVELSVVYRSRKSKVKYREFPKLESQLASENKLKTGNRH